MLGRRNDAIGVNPNIVNDRAVAIAITVRGSNFFYAICAVMGFTALTVLALSYKKPRQDRIFFYITAALNFTACIAYFTMGSNLGWVPINVEFPRADERVAGRNREIFYARYVDWAVTTPLLLTDLLLTAGMPWPFIVWTIFLDEAMIVTGLIGALVQTRYKFGFYTFGCVAMLAVFYELVGPGLKHARALGKDVGRAYFTCGVITIVIWLLYPIAWGLSEGGNVIAPDSEAVFYGILDLIAKPGFSIALIAGHWNIKPERLGLRISSFGNSRALGNPDNLPEDLLRRKERHGEEAGLATAGIVGASAGVTGANHHTSANNVSQTNGNQSRGLTSRLTGRQSRSAGNTTTISDASGSAPVYDRVTEGVPRQGYAAEGTAV